MTYKQILLGLVIGTGLPVLVGLQSITTDQILDGVFWLNQTKFAITGFAGAGVTVLTLLATNIGWRVGPPSVVPLVVTSETTDLKVTTVKK